MAGVPTEVAMVNGGHRRARTCVQVVGLVTVLAAHATAATLPSGFTETQIASGLANPTAMAFAPDGRLFVCQQGGQLRVIKNGSLLGTPFVTVTVNSSGERGLLGVAFDPNFTSNQVTLAATAAGLTLTLDGQPITAPLTFTGVVGMLRTIGAPSPQVRNGTTYEFRSWSDRGAQTHTITTPTSNATITASYWKRKTR
jgi:hypothetical protein